MSANGKNKRSESAGTTGDNNGHREIGQKLPGHNLLRLQFYAKPSMVKALSDFQQSNGMSLSTVVNTALSRYLHEEGNLLKLILRCLENLLAENTALRSEVHSLGDGFLHKVFVDFLHWPKTHPDQRRDSILRANRMMTKFADSLNQKRANGGYLRAFNMDDIKSLILEAAPELDADEVYLLDQEERNKVAQNQNGKSDKLGKPPSK